MKKWRNLIFVALGLALTVGFSCACSSKQAVMVRAEDGETTEVVTEEPQAEEEKEDWAKKSYETFIVPLLSGVSLTSVASLVGAIAITVIKNKKLDKKIIEITERANEKYNQAEEKLVKVTEILTEVNEIYLLVQNSDKLNGETKALIEQKVQYMVTVIDEDHTRIAKVDDLIKITALLVQLEGKVAKQSAEVVKSGIVDDINEIIGLVKKL